MTNNKTSLHQNMFGYLKDTTLTGLGCMILVSLGAFLFVSSGTPMLWDDKS
jgi:hypothetical protein